MSSSTTCSSGAWATRGSPGPYSTVGVATVVDEQARVRAVRHAHERGQPPQHVTGGLAQPPTAADGRSRRAQDGEAAAGDLDFARVLGRATSSSAQAPSITARSSASASADRLVDADAVAALGDGPVGHARRPVAGAQTPDRGGVGESQCLHGTVGPRRRCARLSFGSRARSMGVELVERRDALAPKCRVRRAARHGQGEGDRAGLGGDDLESGRLGDHGGVGDVPGPDRRQRARAAVLLGGHGQRAPLRPDPGRPRPRAALASPPGRPRHRPSCPPSRGRTDAPSRICGEKAGVVHCNSSPGGDHVDVAGDHHPSAGRSALPSRPATSGRFVRGASMPG